MQILQNRENGPRPIYPVHGAGLIITAPTSEAPNGYIALGLRAGNVYPNTLHLIAGSLIFDPTDSSESLQSLFYKSVLKRETQVNLNDIRETSLFARLIDRGLTPGDILYAFRVILKLSKEDLQNTMGDNGSSNQHTSFTFIRNDRDGILDALRKLYKGKTTNDRNRTIEQIEILHPAALALAAHCEIPVVELQKIAEAAGKS